VVLFGALNGLLKDNVSTNLSPIVALNNDDYKVTELLTCVWTHWSVVVLK